jgi:hypothetical protein
MTFGIDIMSKAILVIDMPCCCYECFAFDDSGDYAECRITGDFRGYRFRPREQKMYNCPLQPLPEMKRVHKDAPCHYELGYNSCIDEILKR